jgi:hypothetical protein
MDWRQHGPVFINETDVDALVRENAELKERIAELEKQAEEL